MLEKMKILTVASLLGTLVTAANAETYDWGNVRFDGGGFVSAVVFHPKAENLLYARTDVGGIYRYEFDKKTWVPLMDWVSQNDVGLYGTEAFALDPTDPKRIYVLAGTGYFSQGRTAVLRSEDYGNTWDTSYVEMLAHGNGMGRQTGEKLAVDPNKPNILFCGSRTKGLYKSSDYGKTWTNAYKVALSDASGNGLTNVNGISFVIFDESQGTNADGATRTLYIGISETKDNLQVSNDGGATWKTVSGGPAGLMPHRAKIVDGDMYITYASSEGPHSVSKGAVYKYNIASGAWTNITPFQDESSTARMGDGSQSASHGFGGISIDPKDSRHIVVTTLCYYGGRHLYADGKDGWGDRIYVSNDGGATWTHGQGYNDGVNIDAQDNQWISGAAIHWAGSVEINPFDNKQAWVTSGNGIFMTDDITANVPVWKFQSKGIEETVPLDIVSVPGGPLVTAIGDYDGAAYTDINKSTPRHLPNIGTTNSLGYAPLAKAFVRTGHVTDYSTGTGIESDVMYRSDDKAATWTIMNTVQKGSQGTLSMSADGKVILHRPDNSSDVYRTVDNGKNWTKVTGLDGQSQYARITPDPVNPDVFYLVDQQGYLKISTDGGATFANGVSRLQNDQKGEYYNGGGLIRTVPGREGHLWVPLDQAQVWLDKGYSENGLAYSEDGGQSWTRCEGAKAAIAVGIGKAKEGSNYETVFIWGAAKEGDPIGIYRSTDKCKTFERINDDMHQFGGPGNGNFVQGDMNNFGVVYMSTVGRGLIVGAPEGTEFVTGLKRVNVTAATFMQLERRTLHVSAPALGKLELYAANGKLAYSVDILAKSTAVSLSRLPAGKYMARLKDANGKTLARRALLIQ